MLQTTLPLIHSRLGKAKQGSPLAAAAIRILGASKGQGADVLKEAIAAGITCFGENRVQEAESKWPALKAEHPHVRLHLIGALQTNKVADAVALFDCIESLDRPKLAQALAEELASGSKAMELFIQVNTGEEPQKSGVLPQEADGFIAYCIKELRLPVRGLMCVPPANALSAPHFALLHEMAKRHGLPELSMGMSEDFETAVRLGATEVRLGRVLFGERH